MTKKHKRPPGAIPGGLDFFGDFTFLRWVLLVEFVGNILHGNIFHGNVNHNNPCDILYFKTGQEIHPREEGIQNGLRREKRRGMRLPQLPH